MKHAKVITLLIYWETFNTVPHFILTYTLNICWVTYFIYYRKLCSDFIFWHCKIPRKDAVHCAVEYKIVIIMKFWWCKCEYIERIPKSVRICKEGIYSFIQLSLWIVNIAFTFTFSPFSSSCKSNFPQINIKAIQKLSYYRAEKKRKY